MAGSWLRIGQVARQAGLSPKALRFYEAQGLLPRPRRGENGYRLYEPTTVRELRFIRTAQGLGLRLAEIKGILEKYRRGETPCDHVGELVAAKAAELERQIEALAAAHQRLLAFLAQWQGEECCESCSSEEQDLGLICPRIEVSTEP